MIQAWIQRTKDVAGGWAEVAEAEFPDEAVTVEIVHSALNYKDALAVTGRAPIFRAFPMVAGIDLAGRVVEDRSGRLAPGTAVVATGHGLGETHWGGYAGIARLKADWPVALPPALDLREAAAIGTAGVTAAMAVDALIDHGITPEGGPVLVTGPSGGVGGQAVSLLASAGFTVVAATGRPGEADYLRRLGAGEVIDRKELEGEPRALARERWQAAVDVAGGRILANILSAMGPAGAVAACGLAQSMEFHVTVAPFILRGVSLLGINSVSPPPGRRRRAWERLGRDLDRSRLAAMLVDHRFHEVDAVAVELLDQRVRGRVVLGW